MRLSIYAKSARIGETDLRSWGVGERARADWSKPHAPKNFLPQLFTTVIHYTCSFLENLQKAILIPRDLINKQEQCPLTRHNDNSISQFILHFSPDLNLQNIFNIFVFEKLV